MMKGELTGRIEKITHCEWAPCKGLPFFVGYPPATMCINRNVNSHNL
jgi:hypothetical protein